MLKLAGENRIGLLHSLKISSHPKILNYRGEKQVTLQWKAWHIKHLNQVIKPQPPVMAINNQYCELSDKRCNEKNTASFL